MSAVPSSESNWNIRSTIHVDDAVVTVRLAGRMGSAGADGARSALDDAASRGRNVQLDLREVDYVSSPGLAVLRDAAAAIHASGGTLSLIGVSEPVSVALKLAGEIPHLQWTSVFPSGAR